ncbi:hypothetical protein BS47DRAFT_1374558 [Hydnum rufescens UP504]|uniref:Zn-dependent exopeptidase n=1 Tax=Hydnum rufescens UP504 TaxID=1448309 RepID=A0A9P6BC34_9AGAM|nr:hypothetical protein BS47DRAFT_1374558 [Hydnum rufescens UP504]
MSEKLGDKAVDYAPIPLPTTSIDLPVKSRKSTIFRTIAVLALGAITFRIIHRCVKAHHKCHQPSSLADPDSRGHLTVKQAEQLFLAVPDTQRAIKTSKEYATLPHLAGSGQDFETAKSFLELLQTELSIPTPDELPVFNAGSEKSRHATLSIPSLSEPSAWIDTYFPVLNTPLGRALDIIGDDDQVIWKANLEESEEDGDPAGEYARTIGAWHGLSKEGEAIGKVVYVNYGRKEDFDHLLAAGVDLTGTIALARYGGIFRGLKIKAAEEAGAIGVLIYSDPRDDGSVTVGNGYKPYPEGPARNPYSVQRGTVAYISIYPGDPSTPGVPAYENATRSEGGNIPRIPSIPISWDNAKRILAEIDPDTPFELNGVPSKRRIRLMNQVKNAVTPIWNTMGVIPGHIKNEVIILGNHRDAWVNGAADPISGTVSVVEVIRGLGKLLREGWIPLRTIVIASWDAEEYGLVGSTEWGEDFSEWLQKYAVVYLNLDIGASGSGLSLGGSPSLAHLIRGIAESLPHPTDANRTLWDARQDSGTLLGPVSEWGIDHLLQKAQELEFSTDPYSTGVHALGSGSDYTVFLQRLGIASSDGGFRSTLHDPVYHYHSVYDSHQFQERYADPGFHRHVAIAKYLGLLTLRLTDSIILPINTTQYSLQLNSYLAKIESLAKASSITPVPDFSTLRTAIRRLQDASVKLDHDKAKAEKKFRKASRRLLRKAEKCKRLRRSKFRSFVKHIFGVRGTLAGAGPARREEDVHIVEKHTNPGRLPRKFLKARKAVVKANTKLKNFEKGFISSEGIKDREWFRVDLFLYQSSRRGAWKMEGYGADTFPAITDALDAKNSSWAGLEGIRLSKHINRLAEILED